MTNSTDENSKDKLEESGRHESLHSRLDSIDKKSKENHDNLDVDLDEAQLSLDPMDEFQDDEDAIDRLLMNAGFDADDALMQTEENKNIEAVKDVDLHDDLDDLLGFDSFGEDFSEPETVPLDSLQAAVEEVDESEQSTEDTSAVDDAVLAEDDDFFGLADDFDESDMIEDELEAQTPAVADSNELAAVETSDMEENADELDVFSDFSDFDEPETQTVAAEEVGESEQSTEDSSAVDDAVLAEDDDFFGLADDFDESDMIEDELEAQTPAVADSNELAAVGTSDLEENADELDVFSDFSDFDEPELVPVAEAEDSEQPEDSSAVDVLDEVDEFAALTDDFDMSDLIQDDELEASADSVAPNEEQQPFDEDNLLGDGFDSEDTLEQAVEKSDELADDAGLLDGADDFSGFGDDSDASDLIQDDASADLVTSDEEQQIVDEESSNGLKDDENDFNSLFADAGFDSVDETAAIKDEFGDDADSSEIDNFFQLNEASDDFFAQGEETQSTEAEKPPAQDGQEDGFLLPDFDITADMGAFNEGSDDGVEEDAFADVFGDNGLLKEDEAVQLFEQDVAEVKSGANEAVAEAKPNASAAGTAIEDVTDVKLSPFDFEEEDIKKQLEEAENKIKKAKLFSYAAMGFGVVASLAAAGLGVMMYSAKTEVSKLTETVSTLEASLAKSAANSPSEEIDAMRNSVTQLNQQVDGFITVLKETPQFPVDLLNSNVPNIVAKQDMVSKSLDMLQVKIGSLEEKVSSSPLVTELLKVEVAHAPEQPKEGNLHEMAPAKIETAHEPVKEGVKKELAPTQERAMHEKASAKVEVAPAAPAPEVVPAKIKPQPIPQPQPKAITVKPAVVVPAKVISKQEPVKAKIPAVSGKWGVNLVAVKQEWYAQKTAAEFARQGVFAEIIPIHGNNSTMYRLRVGGFKSKEEANSNKVKIQKALNLGDVWVSDN
jgi:cell division protein FtsN